MFPRDNAKPRELAKYSAPAPHEAFSHLGVDQHGHGSWKARSSLVRGIPLREWGMPRESQRQEQGWSLTELLIVLSIMGIMAALAGPSYQTLAARVQARSATIEIASELRLARQLAMARRERFGSYSIERAVRSRFDVRMPKASCMSISMRTRGWLWRSQPLDPNFYFIPAVGR